ncbi:MAG: tRNA pseudouridine(55) synthase TruB [Candidatus Sumerlaeaceae bacterium]|nr:tRNA pseudouridine(55) synthase TruB [Candidatus Sumerlaeaceae bacterium]
MMRRPKSRKEQVLAGVLPVWKEPGPTSHDVVDMVRRAGRIRQVGHTGTLDPAAAGLLVLCLGPYTKLAPYLMDTDKEYRGYFCLGLETDTDDVEGVVLQVGASKPLSASEIAQAAAQFVGEIDQVPPRFSAVKREGKKLYELARAGKEFEVEPRRVKIYDFEVGDPQACELPSGFVERITDPALRQQIEKVHSLIVRVPFRTVVSSGTYVRSLARDLGRVLGCGGFLLSLERTATGVFTGEQALPMGELETITPEALEDHLVHGVDVIDRRKYPVFHLLPAYASRLQQGQPLLNTMFEEIDEAGEVPSGTICAVADDVGGILAMAQAQKLEGLQRKNPYAGAKIAGFRPLRIFPGGLR